MIGRSVEEWIGKTPDEQPPPRVRLRVFERYKGVCYRSKVKIQVGDAWQCDHVLSLTLGGENRESNLAPILTEAHKAKTREDVAMKSKAYRVRAKHLGVKRKSGRKLQGPGFDKTRTRHMDGTVSRREYRETSDQ